MLAEFLNNFSKHQVPDLTWYHKPLRRSKYQRGEFKFSHTSPKYRLSDVSIENKAHLSPENRQIRFCTRTERENKSEIPCTRDPREGILWGGEKNSAQGHRRIQSYEDRSQRGRELVVHGLPAKRNRHLKIAGPPEHSENLWILPRQAAFLPHNRVHRWRGALRQDF